MAGTWIGDSLENCGSDTMQKNRFFDTFHI